MDQIENCFIPAHGNSFHESFAHNSNRIKMGEVYKLQNEGYTLVCVHCSEEFHYFSEFTLHVEEHLQKLAAENVQCEVRVKEEIESNCSDADEFDRFNDGNFVDHNQESEENDERQTINIKVEEGTEIEQSQVVTKISKSVKRRSKPPKKRKASKAFAEDNNDDETVKKNKSDVANVDANNIVSSETNQIISVSKDPFDEFKRKVAASMASSQVVDTFQARLLAQYYLLDSQLFKRSGKKFSCPLCEKLFKSSNMIRRHVFVHATEHNFLCGVCPKTFRALRHLQNHLEKEHHQKLNSVDDKSTIEKEDTNSVDGYVCFICRKLFPESDIFSDHIKMHTDEKFYSVTLSKQKKEENMKRLLGDDEKLKMEIATDHELKRFKLELTHTLSFVKFIDTKESRVLVKLSLLDRSYERMDDRSFLCPICKEKFPGTNHIRRHIFVHATSNFFECSLCSKTFALQRYLTTHLKESHPERLTESRSFECHLCHKSFAVIGRLVQHMSMHLWRKKYVKIPNGPRQPKTCKTLPDKCPILCEMCGRQFKSAKAMIDHKLIHEAGETKLHICPICDRSFAVQRYLLAHIRRYHNLKITK